MSTLNTNSHKGTYHDNSSIMKRKKPLCAVSHNKVDRGGKVLHPITQMEVHRRCSIEG